MNDVDTDGCHERKRLEFAHGANLHGGMCQNKRKVRAKMSEIQGISKATVKIEGVSPLLMHNGQLANPQNEWVKQIKEITSKHHSKKTESDELELMRLEFQGGLYYDDEIGPFIPSVNVEGCIRDAAKANRLGQAVTAGVQVSPDRIKLIYKGPRGRDELYEDKNHVDARPIKLQKSTTVIRTRPRFDQWAIEFEVMAINEVIALSNVQKFIEQAGIFKGLGDYKPKFGRFILKEFKKV